MKHTPRLRMFAGPNGSGKSTLKNMIQPELLGVYINPDDIEQEILQQGFLNLQGYQVAAEKGEILSFFMQSTLLAKAGLLVQAQRIAVDAPCIVFRDVAMNAYFASVCADFIRQKLIQNKTSFTFETVMSADDKTALLQQAQQQGYRTYLYYVATSDPLINISRVKFRVSQGGHNVPKDKIISRYGRSLRKLHTAIRYSDRAYIFDNSGHSHVWLAEITAAKEVVIKQDHIPQWFQDYVLDALIQSEM